VPVRFRPRAPFSSIAYKLYRSLYYLLKLYTIIVKVIDSASLAHPMIRLLTPGLPSVLNGDQNDPALLRPDSNMPEYTGAKHNMYTVNGQIKVIIHKLVVTYRCGGAERWRFDTQMVVAAGQHKTRITVSKRNRIGG
jgi:hypothetical protein